MSRLCAVLVMATVAFLGEPLVSAAERPSIVYILADDLGYGDLRCLNPDGKIPTPNLDRLAAAGMAFTDAHSGSAVCTPTRYGILTGRYSWRSRLAQGVLFGYDRPPIEPARPTVAGFLHDQGYATACIGKWHLGLAWANAGDQPDPGDGPTPPVDFARPFTGGPTTLGFDTFFGISASLDMPPYIFLRDDRATEVPTTQKQWIRKGPAAASFEAIDVLPALIREAESYITAHAAAAREGSPFFLYLPLTAPHTPILPTPGWEGRSQLNPYADFVMQVDAAVGQVLTALDEHGLADRTLVVFTSDNGCSPQADYPALRARGHDPSYHFRGHKADIFEGGHRVPFIVRWPGHVRPGATSDHLVCLTDLFATVADILGVETPPEAAGDSISFLPALREQAESAHRVSAIHHSVNGSFAIREGRWKLILCRDSGGWSPPRPGTPKAAGLPPVQLYDLQADIGETTNLQAEHPEIVTRLAALLAQIINDGRSTPGPTAANDRPISLPATTTP